MVDVHQCASLSEHCILSRHGTTGSSKWLLVGRMHDLLDDGTHDQPLSVDLDKISRQNPFRHRRREEAGTDLGEDQTRRTPLHHGQPAVSQYLPTSE